MRRSSTPRRPASALLSMIAAGIILACNPSPTLQRGAPDLPGPRGPELSHEALPSADNQRSSGAPPLAQTLPALDLPEIAGIAYLEVVTGGAAAEAELPMIVAFHGNGAFPRLMEHALLLDPGSEGSPAAPYTAPARFVFMRGTLATGAKGHARWFSVTANEAREDPAQLAELSRQIEARANTVGDAIVALAALRPTRGKPIITGHSQGAILTFGLAVIRGTDFSAAYPVAGWLPSPLWPTGATPAPTPIVALHGAEDRVVNFEDSRAAIEQLRARGAQIELHAYPGVQHSLGPMLAELRRLLAAS